MNISASLGIAIAAVGIALASFSIAAHADCAYPKAPTAVPDGKTASEAEMIDAMRAFKSYNEEVTAFASCLEQETKNKSAGTVQLMQLKTLQMKKHNAAIDELQTKAKAFNEQVRLFKARS
jgi:predicted outer membrane protein